MLLWPDQSCEVPELSRQHCSSRIRKSSNRNRNFTFFFVFQVINFFSAFAKLRNVTIRFVLCVGPSVRPHWTTRLPLDRFSWNFIFEDFSKFWRDSSSFIKIWWEYEVESIIIRNAVAFVFLLAALSFARASLSVVFFLSQLCRFEVARSVRLSQL